MKTCCVWMALHCCGPPHRCSTTSDWCCCGSPMVDSAVLTPPLPSFVTVLPVPARDQPPHWSNEAVKLETFIGWEKAALELHSYTGTTILTSYLIELNEYWICASFKLESWIYFVFTLQTFNRVKFKFEYITSQPELKIALLFLLSCLSNICCSHVLYPLAASFKHSWKILFTYLCQWHVEEIIIFHFNSNGIGSNEKNLLWKITFNNSIRKSGDEFFLASNDLTSLTYHGLYMKLETEIPSPHLSPLV